MVCEYRATVAEILLEYEEILTQTYSANTALLVLNQLAIAPNVVFTEPAFRWDLIKDDYDDNRGGGPQVCRPCFEYQCRLYGKQ